MRLFSIFRGILRNALDADGNKIVNLGEPTEAGDSATKKYVDENGVSFDERPTEGSQKAARSGGIWAWVRELLAPISSAISGLQSSKRDLTDLVFVGSFRLGPESVAPGKSADLFSFAWDAAESAFVVRYEGVEEPVGQSYATTEDAESIVGVGSPEYFAGRTWTAERVRDTLALTSEVPGAVKDALEAKLPVHPLPKYLHALSFDDTYPADAEAWYESLAPDAMGGACSAIRRGGLFGRNYDWNYDEASEFVVKVCAVDGANADGSDRHSSVGVASLGAALTEEEVMSGVYSPKYRALPGMTLDGINDAGVVAEINVIPRGGGDPSKGGTRDLHPLAVVRRVLDCFDSAEAAATYVATHYYIPETSAYSFHWMIADAAGKTYIVEDGEKHEVTGAGGSMTNCRLYAEDTFGTGYERKRILDAAESVGAALEATRFTNAYAQGWPWPDEFAADAQIPHTEKTRLRAWADAHVTRHLDPATRKPKARDGILWHTVHSSIYDFAAKTLKVAVQESGEYFTFAVERGGRAKMVGDTLVL